MHGGVRGPHAASAFQSPFRKALAATWLRIIAAGLALSILALLLDGWITAVAILFIALSALQGLRLGAIAILGFVAGTCTALIAAGPLGRLIEPGISALTGLTGLLNRFLCMTFVAVAIVAVISTAGRLLLGALVKPDSPWRTRNRGAGAILGGVEGLALAIGLVWVLLAVEPVATARQVTASAAPASRARYVRRSEPRAELGSDVVIALAQRLRLTALGAFAAATSPFTGARALVVAEAFAAVSRDPYALREFLDSPAFRRVYLLPSYNRAAALASGDIDLTHFFSGDGEAGVDSATLGMLVTNSTILKIMDETTILADFAPLADEFEAAVLQARDQIGKGTHQVTDADEDDYSASGVR